MASMSNTNGAAPASGDVPTISDAEKQSVVIELSQHIKDLKFEAVDFHDKIQRVPEMMRRVEGNQKYYNPSVVSLGPFHHGKPEFQLMEKLKYVILKVFVSGTNKEVDDFYNKVLEVINDVRSYYIEGSTKDYDDEAFSKMMLLDGSLILYLIALYMGDELVPHKPILCVEGPTLWNLAKDMFFLENQIPFLVLQVLMKLKFGEVKGEEMINAHLNKQLFGKPQHQRSKLKLAAGEDGDRPLHLLDACRMKLLHICDQVSQPSHILGSLFGRPKKKQFQGNRDRKNYFHSFRSVTELKTRGIHLRPSSTESLKDIKFKSFCLYGHLELPTLLLAPDMKLIFFNLIAYEMCAYKGGIGFEVTSYINFMETLITHPNDVKELRSKKILFSKLGGDEEVVNMYKEISRAVVPLALDTYQEVSDMINEHYNSRMRTWMAELIYKYFSSPWTVIAFLAATSLVALSFAQTYFTIFPPPGK